ncbi:SRPBCC family protein [Ferrovibrio terrae]|uniref:SRPBCC family protein n=1 Tax=Ferrovibrio terrae TaxID=2594003 RepID=A0A516GWE6_9PROT|nr:SRPBCC family protein [Ferrovibrio terrae]QDO95839.1 SRPBCC family protein [Ferrovibrio terrae]
MPTIRKEMPIAAGIDSVWAAFRDVGAVHRLAPGFVTDCRMEEGGAARIVTFGNGMVAREVIVDVDDAGRRLAYAVVGGRLTHHNASFEVIDDGPGRCRVVWRADLLPADLKPAIEGMMEQGMLAMQRRLEGRAA